MPPRDTNATAPPRTPLKHSACKSLSANLRFTGSVRAVQFEIKNSCFPSQTEMQGKDLRQPTCKLLDTRNNFACTHNCHRFRTAVLPCWRKLPAARAKFTTLVAVIEDLKPMLLVQSHSATAMPDAGDALQYEHAPPSVTGVSESTRSSTSVKPTGAVPSLRRSSIEFKQQSDGLVSQQDLMGARDVIVSAGSRDMDTGTAVRLAAGELVSKLKGQEPSLILVAYTCTHNGEDVVRYRRVCVCMYARARVCMCVCVCVYWRGKGEERRQRERGRERKRERRGRHDCLYAYAAHVANCHEIHLL